MQNSVASDLSCHNRSGDLALLHRRWGSRIATQFDPQPARFGHGQHYLVALIRDESRAATVVLRVKHQPGTERLTEPLDSDPATLAEVLDQPEELGTNGRIDHDFSPSIVR
jgi:hypothetical protein